MPDVSCTSNRNSLRCYWEIKYNEYNWDVIEGDDHGVTQLCRPNLENLVPFNHAIDIHFNASDIVGWPKLGCTVFYEDKFGRKEVLGYSVIPLPVIPGSHDLECHLYRPVKSWEETFRCYFVGGYPQFKNASIIYSSKSRPDLSTQPTETLFIHMNVIQRSLIENGIVNGFLPDN